MKNNMPSDSIRPTHTAVKSALEFDALHAAEKITGDSYKTNPVTEALGFGLHVAHAQQKNALLEAAGDTRFAMSWGEFKALIRSIGFTIHHAEAFVGMDARKEEFLIAYNEEMGALIRAESFAGERVNSGTMYFNYRMNGEGGWNALSRCSSGPTTEKGVRSADYDVREGLLNKIDELRANGEFVSPWIARPFLWLLTYMDTKHKDYSYDAINARRLAILPESITSKLAPPDLLKAGKH